MQLLARTARARSLYRSHHAVVKKMMADLHAALTALLGECKRSAQRAFASEAGSEDLLRAYPAADGELSLRIRADAFVFDNEIVLEEPNPDESIPFIFYRDGIRKLDLTEGLELAELEVLVAAIAEGLSFSGLGDDIVSYLWRHELEHVRSMVVDTTIVDAGAGGAKRDENFDAFDLDEQIEHLLRSIYGSSPTDDVGPRAVRVDGSELAAKDIVASLDQLDEMSPGLHPARAIVEPPAYAASLRAEVERLREDDVTRRVVHRGLQAIAAGLEEREAKIVAEAILKMFDAALVGGAWYLAAWIVYHVRELAKRSETAALARHFVAEAVGEARMRQVAGALSTSESEDTANAIASIFEACGPEVVPAVLGLIPHIHEPQRRRRLLDVAMQLGIRDLAPVRALLTNEQAFVAIEAVHLLAAIDSPLAHELLASAHAHPQAPVRAALMVVSQALPKEDRLAAAVSLLDDPELEVRIAAARALGEIRDLQAVRAIEARVKDPQFAGEPPAIKEAFLLAFVALVQVRGLPVLAKLFQDGGGLLAKREAEESAIAAARALAVLATPGAVQALRKAGTFLNKKVRDAANEALKQVKRAGG